MIEAWSPGMLRTARCFVADTYAAEDAGHWRTLRIPWRESEDSALDAETRERIEAALDRLPARQRAVIVLRDVDGHRADEVYRIPEITAENQRVLLHRARVSVRSALADYLERW